MKEEIKRLYWPNVQLMHETTYRNGIVHGLSKCWHSNGKLIYESTYLNGKRHGLEKQWNDGQFSLETLYKNNLPCGAKVRFKY